MFRLRVGIIVGIGGLDHIVLPKWDRFRMWSLGLFPMVSTKRQVLQLFDWLERVQAEANDLRASQAVDRPPGDNRSRLVEIDYQ